MAHSSYASNIELLAVRVPALEDVHKHAGIPVEFNRVPHGSYSPMLVRLVKLALFHAYPVPRSEAGRDISGLPRHSARPARAVCQINRRFLAVCGPSDSARIVPAREQHKPGFRE